MNVTKEDLEDLDIYLSDQEYEEFRYLDGIRNKMFQSTYNLHTKLSYIKTPCAIFRVYDHADDDEFEEEERELYTMDLPDERLGLDRSVLGKALLFFHSKIGFNGFLNFDEMKDNPHSDEELQEHYSENWERLVDQADPDFALIVPEDIERAFKVSEEMIGVSPSYQLITEVINDAFNWHNSLENPSFHLAIGLIDQINFITLYREDKAFFLFYFSPFTLGFH